MPQPVVTVLLGGTDISLDVAAEIGGTSLTFGRGANFDGTSESPGTAVISVRNAAGKYNPANSGSSIAAQLKVGKEVRVTCVYSAVTYYLFHGYLRRIVPIPGVAGTAFAELHCEDALWKYGRAEATLLASESRSLSEYRGVLLDAAGDTGLGRRSLSGIGAEASKPINYADSVNVLSELAAIGRATGTLHFVKPTATEYQYTTLDRNTLQSSASAETWSDTDAANPFATDLGGYDYTDEGIVNYQRVQARPLVAEASELVWVSEEADATVVRTITSSFLGGTGTARRARTIVGESIYLLATTSTTIWVDHGSPVFDRSVVMTEIHNGTAPGVVLTEFPLASQLVITAGSGDAWITALAIRGRPTATVGLDASISEDAASQTTYNGDYRGSSIDSELIDSAPSAEGLGAWIVYRYKDPRARPSASFTNRFPSQLQREIGERVTLTSSVLSLSAVQFFIRSFQTSISGSGAVWTTSYELEAAPATVNIFTVGGTADQGLGGTAILGY